MLLVLRPKEAAPKLRKLRLVQIKVNNGVSLQPYSPGGATVGPTRALVWVLLCFDSPVQV